MTKQIRILLVDDHVMLRQGVKAIIASEDDLSIVAEAADGTAAVALHEAHRPDVTLMDMQMPKMDGLAAIRAIREKAPTAKIIVLTTYEGDAIALSALKAGAAGYLLKSSLIHELLDTIRSVHAGRRHIPAELAQEIALHAADEPLSEREVNILELVASGQQNKQIAWQLSLSEETVKAHLRNIFGKLGVGDRTQAVTTALKRGIIRL